MVRGVLSNIYLPTQDNTAENLNSGDRIFLWDHTHDLPIHSDQLPSVRFGGTSMKISNRYLPECRSKYITNCLLGQH